MKGVKEHIRPGLSMVKPHLQNGEHHRDNHLEHAKVGLLRLCVCVCVYVRVRALPP